MWWTQNKLDSLFFISNDQISISIFFFIFPKIILKIYIFWKRILLVSEWKEVLQRNDTSDVYSHRAWSSWNSPKGFSWPRDNCGIFQFNGNTVLLRFTILHRISKILDPPCPLRTGTALFFQGCTGTHPCSQIPELTPNARENRMILPPIS